MTDQLTARLLPPEEWAAQLAGTPLEGQPLVPDLTLVTVVEDQDGRVVACWAAMNTIHVEGLWVAEAHRGTGGAARALLREMIGELVALGTKEVLTTAETPEIEAFIQHVGGRRIPGSQWVLPLLELAPLTKDGG